MAQTANPIMDPAYQLLINDPSTGSGISYKITYQELYDNITYHLSIGGPGPNPGKEDFLRLDDLIDVETLVRNSADDSITTNLTKAGYILQAEISLDGDQIKSGDYIYRPVSVSDAIKSNNIDVGTGIGGGSHTTDDFVKLDDLADVIIKSTSTNADGSKKYDVGLGDLLVVTTIDSTAGEGLGYQFENRTLGSILENAPDIVLQLDNLKDVFGVRLITNPLWYEGSTDIPKYFQANPASLTGTPPGYAPEPEDIIQYISGDDIYTSAAYSGAVVDSEGIDWTGTGANAAKIAEGKPVTSTDPKDRLPATPEDGFYYIIGDFGDEIAYADGTQEERGKLYADPKEPGEALDSNTDLEVTDGIVRVATYRDTTFLANSVGDLFVKQAGLLPSNIGISDTGVLYSEIPSSLGFVTTLKVVVTADGTGAHGDTYITLPGGNKLNANQGPGSKEDPENWTGNPGGVPSTGDFYVLQFVEASGTPVTNPDSFPPVNLTWNTAYLANDPTNPAQAPVIVGRDGDMVAFGEIYWNVIGTVNTDTVAQDLQSVTDRGRFTDNAVHVGYTEADSNAVNTASTGAAAVVCKGYADLAGDAVNAYAAGDIAGATLRVNTIDFNFIKPLPTS